jgi:2,3,4,5-tetrahydropyridine-2-carboxylate N-succinyltransferase
VRSRASSATIAISRWSSSSNGRRSSPSAAPSRTCSRRCSFRRAIDELGLRSRSRVKSEFCPHSGRLETILQATIEAAWEQRSSLSPRTAPAAVRDAVDAAIAELDAGRLRVAEKTGGGWVTHQWLKKAVLLSFRLADNVVTGTAAPDAPFRFYDKVPTKFSQFDDAAFTQAGVRVVPPAVVRRGAYVAPNVVLMPSYVNIGAYVDEGTMVDTWATVGSCAQIGKNVHLSGGAGIGGVLEPLQANPTIIEDNCFIGARSEVVEGVIVEENSVLGMGVFLGQSTKIYHRSSGEVSYGRIPAGSVVVAGSLPSGDRGCQLYCVVIVKQVDARTRAKTSINDLLRS